MRVVQGIFATLLLDLLQRVERWGTDRFLDSGLRVVSRVIPLDAASGRFWHSFDSGVGSGPRTLRRHTVRSYDSSNVELTNVV